MWEIIGCYGLFLACVLGSIVMCVTGQITYEWLMDLAIANDIFIEPPPIDFGSGAQAEGFGQAMGLAIFFYGLPERVTSEFKAKLDKALRE